MYVGIKNILFIMVLGAGTSGFSISYGAGLADLLFLKPERSKLL
jgi:hypothetical protein